LLGHKCSENILTHVDEDGVSLCKGRCPLAASISDGKSCEARVYLHHKAGHRVPVWVRVTPLKNESGETIGGAEIFTNVSNESAMGSFIKELEDMALLDKLTNLPNRNQVEPQIEARIHELKRYGYPFGLLFMDIDHFKNFNDTYGHDVGDQVLRMVANTVSSSLRPFDLMGRWGGEEFIGVLKNVDNDRSKEICERFRMLIERSYITTQGKSLKVTVSMGATAGLGEDSMDELIKRADKLMYQSKENGRNQVTVG